MKLLIDGDPIVYRIGFACQKKDKETGLVTADPESHTLHSCKQFINQMLEETGADTYKIYLTGKGNFRYKVREDYKANRKGADKPVHYQLVRDYLVKKFKAQVVDGMEADDALALGQQSDTAIASIDKDLLMVEGRHYNYGKCTWQDVTAKQGEYFFYKQMLTGDRVDNITGIRGLGEKKASKLLDTTPREDWDETIIKLYMKEFEDGYHRAVQNTQLLWMLQRDKQMPMDFK
jgi:5'-3' exonuclease